MKVIDLTHTISEDMPVFPGTKSPVIVDGCTIDKDGFAEKTLTMFTHTGTHMDAPAHVLKGKRTLDQFPAGHFVGKAVVLDCTSLEGKINLSDLKKIEIKLESADFLILKTGWDQYWGKGSYFNDFPVLSIDAAKYLIQLDLRGIGVDTISVDPVDAANLPIHRVLFEKELIIVENLKLPIDLPDEFIFSCLPLHLHDADGSPIRAVAMV